MTIITKPNYTNIWSSGGAKVAPNDTKIQQGWTAEVPPFQYENWIQNRQDQFIAHVNQRGIPVWDGLSEYEGGGLSYTQGSNGVVYKSVTASGPSLVVQNPTTDGTGTYWVKAFATLALATESFAGVVELATPSETVAGLLSTLATHPAGVLAALTAFLPKRSFTTTDFIRIPDVPGGLIIQWFPSFFGFGSDFTGSFPIAFPTSCVSVSTTCNYTPGSGTIASHASIPISRTQYVVRSSGGLGAQIIAIGY
jgi:hypothetical protein